MSKPIPYEVRRQVIRLKENGQGPSVIAETLGLSRSAVQKLLRLWQMNGESALQTRYSNCGKNAPQKFDLEIVAAIQRQRDSSRGGPFVYSLLVSQQPQKSIPHYRTIQRWWAKGKTGEGPVLPPRRRERWSKEPHETWQIDGKELIKLADGTETSWMNIADEATSTVLQTTVFSPEADG
jgi:Winged helix-turn helix